MSNHSCFWFPFCQVQHKNADLSILHKKWWPTYDYTILFDVFSDPCVKHDPVAGCQKGLKHDRCLFFFPSGAFSFSFGFLCLWHQFSASWTVSWKANQAKKSNAKKKKDRMKILMILQGKNGKIKIYLKESNSMKYPKSK